MKKRSAKAKRVGKRLSIRESFGTLLTMWKNNQLKIISVIISLLLALWIERAVFSDPYAINDDVRNQAYWMLRLINPHFFPGDLAASYFCQPSLISPLLQGLYAIASHWMSPIRFSQFLPFLVAPLTTYIWFSAAEYWNNKRFAFWTSLVLNCAIWMTPMMAGGLPRSFFYPLFFLFLWLFSLENSTLKRAIMLGLVAVLQSLIYPSTFLLSAGLLLFDGVRKVFSYKQGKRDFKAIMPHLIAISSGVISILLRYNSTIHSNSYGPLVNAQDAPKYLEFYPGGRVPIFSLEPGFYPDIPFLKVQLHDMYMRFPEWHFLILLIFFLLFSFIAKESLKSIGVKIPQLLLDLPWVSMFLYTLAILFLFYLYVPMRYLEPPLSVCSIFLIGSVIYWLDGRVTNMLASQKQQWRYRDVQLGCTILMTLMTIGVSSRFWKEDLIHVPPVQRQLFSEIKKLPVNSRISASYWIIANNIPVFSERAVLVNREVNIPFHTNYYRQMKTRFLDWLDAYYSDSPDEMRRYIEKYQIDYLVMSTWDFTEACIKNRKKHFVKDILPTDFIDTALERQQSGSFWFAHTKGLPVIARSGPYMLIDAKRLKNTIVN